MVTLASQVA